MSYYRRGRYLRANFVLEENLWLIELVGDWRAQCDGSVNEHLEDFG